MHACMRVEVIIKALGRTEADAHTHTYIHIHIHTHAAQADIR